jgi:hypothetical protein
MADLGRARTATSTRTRSRSRPSRASSPPGLDRLLSAQFPDDHSVYHHENGDGVHEDVDARSLRLTESERREAEAHADEDSDSISDDTEEEKNEEAMLGNKEITVEEIRGGIPDERDVEVGPQKLEKKQSSRSIKDPNLVSISYSKYMVRVSGHSLRLLV